MFSGKVVIWRLKAGDLRSLSLAILIDITREEQAAQQDYMKNLETVEMAQKVIDKQMMVAQQIAGLLGETTAETKVTLTNMCKTLLDDE